MEQLVMRREKRKNSSPETTQPGYLGDDAGGRNPHEGTRKATDEVAVAGFNSGGMSDGVGRQS
jgi:hypothetical protein